jgi:polyisoprenoid-binding protein YceI
MLARVVGLMVFLIAARAHAQPAAGASSYQVRAEESSLTYHLVHKLHKVNGVSKRVEGRARIQPGGLAQVMARAPIESFDSGNSNRDAHMKEATEAARFPHVELKATASNVVAPATFPATFKTTFKAQLTFHGVQQSLDVPVEITFSDANRIVATATITISLDRFKVERPSLMFVKVNDDVSIDAHIVFVREGAK